MMLKFSNNMTKLVQRFAMAAFTAAVALTATAATPRQEIAAVPGRAASNHFAYPYPALELPRLSAAPKGYEPFYIDHYGRHGSRWLTSKKSYNRPVAQLELAARHGALTPVGRALLDTLRMVADAARGRIGELTDIGAEQHQGIATRMARNFPEVFSGDARIDARSTTVIRCILSMQNETMTLRGFNPRLRVTTDVSLHDMHYLGWGRGEDTCANALHKRMRRLTDSVERALLHPARFAASLIADRQLLRDSIDQLRLMADVFDVAGSLQGHKAYRGIDLYKLFTADEVYDLWRNKNIYWYVQWANAPQTGNRMPYIERALLANMLSSADSALATGQRGASLRFGHETCLLPLACLMELDSVNYSCRDLSTLADHWQNYNIFPKGCNIQMVFYRRTGARLPYNASDVLVKVLLNEHEATLPVKAVSGPYYRWSDVRAYYERKLSRRIDWTD